MEDQNQIIPSTSEENPSSEENYVLDESERKEIEDLIGYRFKNPALLQQAFTHVTVTEDPSKSYERLEYIGDAALGIMVAVKHFFDYPDFLPGKLTTLRSANVDTEKLSRAAVKWNLHKHLRHKKPLLNGQIEEFLKEIEEYPTYSAGLVHSPKNLADVFESLVGAIFIDTELSLQTTWQVVERLLEPMVTRKSFRQHPMARLNEYCQKKGLKLNFKENKLREKGEVSVEVYVNDKCVFERTYVTKTANATNRAADDAYSKIISEFQAEEPDHIIPSTSEENPASEENTILDDAERKDIEDLMGYGFKNPAHLKQAFTHPTADEHPSRSYERLEYVGDAALGLLVATKHFFDYPDFLPGKLTSLRSANVDTEKLSRAAVKWSLHKHLRHKKPLLDGQIEEFLKEIEEYPAYTAGLVHCPKNLADVFESLVGAIFIDSELSLQTTRKVVERLLEPMVTSACFRQHPVARLNEYCQKKGLKLKFKDNKFPDKREVFVQVYLNDDCVFEKTYLTKTVNATNRAADDAYNKIISQVPGSDDVNV